MINPYLSLKRNMLVIANTYIVLIMSQVLL